MTNKLKSIIITEVVKSKAGKVLASRQYNHTINFNHREIERETVEVITSPKRSVVVSRQRARFKTNKNKVIGINLLTGEIF